MLNEGQFACRAGVYRDSLANQLVGMSRRVVIDASRQVESQWNAVVCTIGVNEKPATPQTSVLGN